MAGSNGPPALGNHTSPFTKQPAVFRPCVVIGGSTAGSGVGLIPSGPQLVKRIGKVSNVRIKKFFNSTNI